MLDVQHTGYLTEETLHHFFMGIQKQMQVFTEESVNYKDISNEIFDMVKPKDPSKITLQDLNNWFVFVVNIFIFAIVILMLNEFHFVGAAARGRLWCPY